MSESLICFIVSVSFLLYMILCMSHYHTYYFLKRQLKEISNKLVSMFNYLQKQIRDKRGKF